MKTVVRHYKGEHIDVSYDVRRCIHAEECIKRLPDVFNSKLRPWIQPDQSSAESVTQAVIQCSSGALHYMDAEAVESETPPAVNTIRLAAHGPLYVHGNVVLTDADTNILLEDTRIALCRCGASNNKPLCDNTHRQIDFNAISPEPTPVFYEPRPSMEKLVIQATRNGSLHVLGEFIIVDDERRNIFAGEETWLCRCGGSSNKPFCDGTHKRIGFQSENETVYPE